MSYILLSQQNKTMDELIQDNIVLKKELMILEKANEQLKSECDSYKTAYQRYSSFFIIKIAKKLLGR